MTLIKLLPRAFAILFAFVVFISCQQDPSTIGSEILGTEAPNGILDDSQTVIAYSRKLSPVQTNRLPGYQLGVYKDPVYGKSSVSLLSQIKLETNDPKFGNDAKVDSVFVYIPYFSKATVEDSTTTYTLDSIYGSAPINITIFESKYFLRDLDPETGFEKVQPYYSNQGPLFESYLGEQLASVENFIPSPAGYILREGEEDESKLAPGLRIALPKEFFQERIVDKEGSQDLLNNNNFKNYLRGLYFQVNSPTNDGSLFIFDVSKAYVQIHYTNVKEEEPEERIYKTFKLSLGDITVNTFENEPLPQFIQTALENPDTIMGNENLYLRGGDGIISIVELFGPDSDNNGVADQLEMLRDKKWLINEANLIFYVNRDLMVQGGNEPDRIMIYDLKNSNVLVDYLMDSTNGLPAADAMSNHLGKLEKDSDGKGKYYKIRITNHISNLINKDSTNVPLGIVVSHNVKNRTTQKLLNPQDPSIEEVPSSEVLSHKGTILYGNSSANTEKKLKLQIYYTKPE
ncbi:DUF4270 domain-containing protein [Aequorivita sp. H23M31]|uniref:DUF4270 domain-containing protein n=1 Tax=Aequorivita ciconiae TaxID=2494375 RepID=A0A410G3P4_9FLAO|nr:DUF4270 domain-containing protein [Aequorivita sp. H23M31]QAA81886.1 DUF4270 domain-containing protein [Aequorivita sp. H23M31]